MSDPETRVRLNLHNVNAVVCIGEPVNPELQAVNESGRRLKLGRHFVFDWDDLAFAEPDFVHLVGPDGAELALPYRRDPSYFRGRRPLTIAAGKEEWQYLPVYAHFHLRAPGDYKFWLELADESGAVHRSEVAAFTLRDVEYSMPPGSLALAIAPSPGASQAAEVEAVFTNSASRPLVVLAPQEDSFDGWVNPIYQFTVIDDAGRVLPLARRSGSMATPHYGASMRIILEPGRSRRLQLRLPDIPAIRREGNYRVRLTYIVRNRRVGKAGTVIDQPMNWDDDVFVGRVESNEITVRVP
jgi:hypothetical protein